MTTTMSILYGNDVEFHNCGICPLDKDLIKMSLILEVHTFLITKYVVN